MTARQDQQTPPAEAAAASAGAAPRYAPQLLNQERAVFALAQINIAIAEVDQRTNDTVKRDEAKQACRSLLEGFPANVRQTGAGQAVALLMSDSNPQDQKPKNHASRWLLSSLGDWLSRPGQPLESAQQLRLMDGLVNADRDTYLRAQEEMIVIAGWLKTFAQALLPSGRSGS